MIGSQEPKVCLETHLSRWLALPPNLETQRVEHPRYESLHCSASPNADLGECIAAGRRNETLFALARGLKARGLPARIVASGLNYRVVSIDGATQPVYERYRVKGRLDVVLRNLDALVERRTKERATWPVVEWQFLAMKHNVDELDAARTRAIDAGVDVFRYGGARGEMATKTLVSTPENFQASRDYLLPAAHELSEYDAAGNKARVKETEGCKWLWGKLAMHPDGGIAPCWNGWSQEHDLDRWRPAPVADGWNGPAYRRARKTAVRGGDAEGASMCERCAHHKNFVPPPDRDDEPLLGGEGLRRLATELADAGLPPDPAVVAAVDEGLRASSGHAGRA